MPTNKYYYLFFWIILVGYISSIEGKSNRFLLEMELPDIGEVMTVMNIVPSSDSTYRAFSRKKATQDLFGNTKYRLGRIFTKRFNREGSLFYIKKGDSWIKGDTTFLSGTMETLIGDFEIDWRIVGDQLDGVLDVGESCYKVRGSLFDGQFPLQDYKTIFNNVIDTTRKYIYNRALIEENNWHRFVKKMTKVIPYVYTDFELIVAFSHFAEKLSFSHFALFKETTFDFGAEEEAQLTLVPKNKTAYLDIASFMGTVTEIDSMMEIIKTGSFNHLIVDLRNNGGGSVAPGLAFARHLVDTSFWGGVLLSRKWFETHDTLPAIADYIRFKAFSEENLELLIQDLHQEEGICLQVEPKPSTFKGDVYLLTNKYTGSTCEPIVYGLQQHQLATVIGERTAGSMLSAEIFSLAHQFSLFLPTATYYTSDGYKIDQRGVEPDIKVKSKRAWSYIKKRLKKNNYN